MSLKSKLEAVIYAAEEPVTLTQLATLFGGEALELKAAQEAAAAQKAAVDPTATAVDPSQPVIAEGLEFLDLRTEDGTLLEQPGFAVLPVVEPDAIAPESLPEQEPATTSDPQAETGAKAGQPDGVESQIIENAEKNSTLEAPAAEAAPLDPEAEARRIARQRDRDIKNVLRQLIDELIAEYARDDRGIEI